MRRDSDEIEENPLLKVISFFSRITEFSGYGVSVQID
jgi:hypothetical protein